jgi:hypothetical protein
MGEGPRKGKKIDKLDLFFIFDTLCCIASLQATHYVCKPSLVIIRRLSPALGGLVAELLTNGSMARKCKTSYSHLSGSLGQQQGCRTDTLANLLFLS